MRRNCERLCFWARRLLGPLSLMLGVVQELPQAVLILSVALDILWLGYFATLQSFIQFTENILCAWHYARDDNNTKK